MGDTVSLSDGDREESRTAAIRRRSITTRTGALNALRCRNDSPGRQHRSLVGLAERHLNRLIGTRGVDVSQCQLVPRRS